MEAERQSEKETDQEIRERRRAFVDQQIREMEKKLEEEEQQERAKKGEQEIGQQEPAEAKQEIEQKAKQQEPPVALGEEHSMGVVQIADDVVAMIASLATTEVEGVHAMAGNITNELMSKVGVKKLTRGVRVDVKEGNVKVDLAVTMEYGYNIPATCQKVQAKVKAAIENMTGLTCSDVNIRIAGVKVGGNKQ